MSLKWRHKIHAKTNHTLPHVSNDVGRPARVSDDIISPAHVGDHISNPARVSDDISGLIML